MVRSLAVDVEAADDRAAARRSAGVTFARRLVFDGCWLLGATVLVELVFSLPGLGHTMVQALFNFDIPMMVGLLLFVCVVQAALYVAANLVGAAVSKEWRRS